MSRLQQKTECITKQNVHKNKNKTNFIFGKNNNN